MIDESLRHPTVRTAGVKLKLASVLNDLIVLKNWCDQMIIATSLLHDF